MMETQTSEAAPFGERLFEASCKVNTPPAQSQVDAVAEVWTLGLVVRPLSENTVFLAYTESPKIEASNYRVLVSTSAGTIILSQLGAKYERFAQTITNSWSDALAKALLMEEASLVYEAACFASTRSDLQTVQSRIRIYDTALVILPLNTVPIRIPFSSLKTMQMEGFKIRLTTSEGAMAEISKLGNATQLFFDKLKAAKKNLEERTLETIKSMVPSASFEELNSLSSLMIEGRAAPRKEVERISAGLWNKLEKSVELSPLAESYQYLSTLGLSELESLGLRKTLNSVYLWLMIPLMKTQQEGGNAVVMEVTSESGHATYLFRVVPRDRFASTTGEEFAMRSEILIRDLNEAIVATGFRREPIYLPDEQLNRPEYSKYLYASTHLESLRLLRDHFFARIIHNTLDQWKADLADALHFNIFETNDALRWSSGSTSAD